MQQSAKFPESPDGQTYQKGKVLIVDDDRVVCSFARKILEHEGHKVETADSLVRGVEALRTEFDVAVVDVDLPDGKGFELVEHMRQSFRVPIPVVLITGNPVEEYLDRSVVQGITEFLFKPFRASELRASVERAVAAKRLWEERVKAVAPGDRERRSGTHLTTKQIPDRDVGKLCDQLAATYHLTLREKETLAHMLRGLQNADIADELRISANTVKYHVRNVLAKLRMTSRTELFRSLLSRD